MPALSISGETAERMTDPHGAPLARPDPDHTAPGRPLAVSGEETMAMAGLLSQGRPVERTPTSLPLTRSPYFWVGLGVALGFALMGLLFALYG
jgi:hypothetical protein